MVSHKDFVEEAIAKYRSMPAETNELYKKYFIEIPLDKAFQISAPTGSNAKSVQKEVEAKTNITFDAVISDGMMQAANDKIRIVKASDIDSRFFDSKIFKSSDDKLAAFSNASATHFIFIETEEGKKEHANILFVNSGNLSVQVIINAKKDSRLDVFELYMSEKTSSSAVVSALHEISSAKGSEVELNALHNENERTNVIALCKGVTQDDAKLRVNMLYAGGLLTRSKNIMDSSGTNAQIDVSEFMFGVKDQRFDVSTFMSNSKPSSIARLETGAVLDGNSQSMLKGFAKVEKGTKGCFSRITERGILLSKDAHIDALPDMSIDYSNEVKATHSAATAPIDEEALFYLQSRGLKEEQARKTFITAFIAKYISNMKSGIANAVAMSVMLEKMEKGTYGIIPEVTTKGLWV